ncbi:MAG: site-2 protease family protein [Actinomycetota bacterium]
MIPRKGFRIASFRDISVYLHWSWFIVFFLILWVVVQFFQLNTDAQPASYIPIAVVTTFLFFLSVLVHEFSHSLVANRNGIPIRRITLFVFGGVAQMDRDVPSPGVEFKMAVAGPLCSYGLCLLFGLALYIARGLGAGTVASGFMLLALVNFGLGTFNLIPGFPLDGGRILRSLLWYHWSDLERSTRAASRLGEAVGAVLVLGGVALLVVDFFQTTYDLLFASVWFILVGTFLIQAAFSSFRQVQARVSLGSTDVRGLMRTGVPALDSSATLEEAYRTHLERSPASTIPVLRQGRLAATVGMAELRSVDPGSWPNTPVARVARPLGEGDAVTTDMPLFEAMLLMERSGRQFLWVVEDGRLVGVLLLDDARRMAKPSRE